MISRRVCLTRSALLALVLSVASASPAFSAGDQDEPKKTDDRPPARSLGGSGIRSFDRKETFVPHLLLSEVVQNDIGLTDTQFERINELWYQQAKRNQRIPRLPSDTDPEIRARVEAQARALSEVFDAEVRAQLDAGQVQRLVQISIRNSGIRAFAMPQVASELKLSQPQVLTIAEALSEMDSNNAQLYENEGKISSFAKAMIANDDYAGIVAYARSPERKKRIAELGKQIGLNHERAKQRVEQTLTNSQKETFARFLGKPIVEGQ